MWHTTHIAATRKQQSHKHAKNIFTYTTQQLDGRFVVRLPTKMEPNQLGSSRLSAAWNLHAIELKLERHPEPKVQYHNFMRKYKEIDHRDPVNSQEGKTTCYCLPHPVFEEKGSTTRTWIVLGGCAKPSSGTEHNWSALTMDRFYHSTDMDTGST